jgi:hypothetical protein
MQPTPRDQDTTETRTVREAIAAQAATWGGDCGAIVLGFAAQLSEAQAAAFVPVLNACDNLCLAARIDAEDAYARALAAHLPGLAPTLRVLHGHLIADTPTCVDLDHEPREDDASPCRLARAVGFHVR